MNRKLPITTCLFVVGLVFFFLKLFGVISWSWWWVFSPFLLWLGITIILFALLGIVTMIGMKQGVVTVKKR